MSKSHPPTPAGIKPSNFQVTEQIKYRKYLDERESTYEMRVPRYLLVANILKTMDLDDTHQILDFCAGQTEFDYHMRTAHNWRGFMYNLDGAIQGKNLNHYWPEAPNDFTVCIESIEHLDHPGEVVAKLEGCTNIGMVFTTPNPDVVDVLALDKTHKHAISVSEWHNMMYKTAIVTFCGTEDDTIVAYKDMRE